MRRITASAFMCFGNGICTRMPWTRSSALSRSTISRSSSWLIVAGRRIVSPCIPSSLQVRSFAPTYTALAGSSPTSTTDNPGVMPRAFNTATFAATSTFTCSASLVPWMIFSSIVASASKVHRPGFPNEHNLDLPWILQLGLDPACDLLRHRRHAHVVDVIGDNDDANFAPCLNGKHLVHAFVAGRNLLEALETFDVRLERFAAGTRARARDGVCRLDENGHLALVRNVVMVRGNAVHHERIFAVFRGDFDAQLDVGALMFVRQDLSDVVQQRSAARHVDVEPELGRHDRGEPSHLLRVLEDVLAVTGTPAHPPDELDQLRVQAVNAGLVRCLFTRLDDLRVDFLPRLV